MSRTKQPAPKVLEYDETIMNALLAEPEVRKSVLKMTAGELVLFKELLVSQGVYSKYVTERKKK